MIPSRFRSRLLLLLLLRATFVYEGRRGTLNGQPTRLIHRSSPFGETGA